MRLLVLLAASLLSACASKTYIPFTQEFRDNEGFSAAELEQLQYYVCPPLIVEREVKLEEKAISSGRLIRKQGRLIDEVVVPRWTPGIAVKVTSHYLAVSFEEGTSFTFGVESGAYRGDYTPLGRNRANLFEVYYDSQWYEMVEEGSVECQGGSYGQARLWIDADSLKEISTERKVLKGRKISRD